jgi:hypothetical protein
LTDELNHVRSLNAKYDEELDKYQEIIRNQRNLKEDAKHLIYLSQYIDHKLNRLRTVNNPSIEAEQFVKKDRSKFISMEELFQGDELQLSAEQLVFKLPKWTQSRPRTIEEMEQAMVELASKSVTSLVTRQFHNYFPFGTTNLINKTIEVYKFFCKSDMVIKEQVESMTISLKDKQMMVETLNKALMERRKLEENFRQYRGGRELGYMEHFGAMVSEETVTQDGNMLGIHPHLLRKQREQRDHQVDGSHLAPVEASLKQIFELYRGVTPEDIARNHKKLLFLLALKDQVKFLGRRLFDLVQLVKFLWEKRLLKDEAPFRTIDDLLYRSQFYKKSDFREEIKRLNPIGLSSFGTNKHAGDVPQAKLVICKEDEPGYRGKDLRKYMEFHFNIPEDYIVIKEVEASEFVMLHTSLEEVRQIIRIELDAIKRSDDFQASLKMVYLNQIAPEIFQRIMCTAAKNYSQKLMRNLKEIDSLLRELIYAMRDITETSITEQLMYNVTNDDGKQNHHPMPGYLRDFEMIKSYKKAIERYFSQERVVGKQLAMELSSVVKSRGVEDSEDYKTPELNVDDIKRMITWEKRKQSKPLKSNPNQGNKSIKAETTVPVPAADSLWQQRDSSNNEFKEIMGYGTTLRSIKKCLDKQAKDAQHLLKIPSMVNGKLGDRSVLQRMKSIIESGKGETVDAKRLSLGEEKGGVWRKGVRRSEGVKWSEQYRPMGIEKPGEPETHPSEHEEAGHSKQPFSARPNYLVVSPDVGGSPHHKNFTLKERRSSFKISHHLLSPRGLMNRSPEMLSTRGLMNKSPEVMSPRMSYYLPNSLGIRKESLKILSRKTTAKSINRQETNTSSKAKDLEEDLDSYILSPF